MSGSLRARRVAIGVLVLALCGWSLEAEAQVIAGQNVNMVAGLDWPGGDPFLERQNEPSITVSSANRRTLVAGANDYRSVDIAVDPGSHIVGDAWLGVFKSFDAGLTWRSTLLPGYPMDTSAEGVASPIHGYAAAADPVFRAGTDGLLYLSGMAFNRNDNAAGQVFVSRFIDVDDGRADPVLYLDTQTIDLGTSGQFLDKPWLATDIPRTGASQCSITVPDKTGSTTRTLTPLAGNVYLTWASFTGSNTTKVMFTRSLDCGKTWATPQKLSESQGINQGTTIAVDPTDGSVHVVWRRFRTSNQSDAIVYVRSTNGGKTFTKPAVLWTMLNPFDQSGTTTQFRENAFPTIAVSVDANGKSRVHVAWSQRPDDIQTYGTDARIYMMTLSGNSWSGAAPVSMNGQSSSGHHQFMPALTFTQRRLMLLYYDASSDHTRYYLKPDLNGAYDEVQLPLTDARWSGDEQAWIDDWLLSGQYPLFVRHTIGVSVAVAPNPGDVPSFTSNIGVSSYAYGNDDVFLLTQPVPTAFQDGVTAAAKQVQFNTPNLPMFRQGTAPFIGDYIDIAGPMFTRVADSSSSFHWTYLTLLPTAFTPPVAYAVWTTNQDVVPPPDGDWTKHTLIPLANQVNSIMTGQPLTDTDTCNSTNEAYVGTRNQNVYSSTITETGVVLSSPQNAKPLDQARTFVVDVQNWLFPITGDSTVHLRLKLTDPSVPASFSPTGPAPSVDVDIGPGASTSQLVFVQPSNSTPIDASIPITAYQLDYTCTTQTPPCETAVASIVLNPPGSATGAFLAYGGGETHGAAFKKFDFNNVKETTIAYGSGGYMTGGYMTGGYMTGGYMTGGYMTGGYMTGGYMTGGYMTGGYMTAPPSEASFEVVNTGTAETTVNIDMIGTSSIGFDVLLSKTYDTSSNVGCERVPLPHTVTVAGKGLAAGDSCWTTYCRVGKLTLRAGEKGIVTVLGQTSTAGLISAFGDMVPMASTDGNPGESFPFPRITSSTFSAQAGTAFTGTLQSVGGTPPLTWSSTDVPSWLTVDSSSGQLTGTPPAAGTYSFTASVTDTATQDAPAVTVSKTITIVASAASTTTTLSAPTSPTYYGQAATVTATVTSGVALAGTTIGTVTFNVDGVDVPTPVTVTCASACTASLSTSTLGAGNHAIVGRFTPSNPSLYLASTSSQLTLTISPAITSTSLTLPSATATYGDTLAFTATVSVVSGGGTPAGKVEFTDGAVSLGFAALGCSAGVCTATLSGVTGLAGGTHSITATYIPSSQNYLGSLSSAVSLTVAAADTLTALSATASAVYGQLVTFTATVTHATGATDPTATVEFLVDSSSIGEAALVCSSGACTATTSWLATVGPHTVTATYNPQSTDLDYATSSDTLAPYYVDLARTTIVLSAPKSSIYGQPVTLTATVAPVAPGSGEPTGSVTFSDGTMQLGAPTLSCASGSCTASVSTTLGAGAHALTATYAGDTDFYGSSTTTAVSVNVTYAFTGFLSPLKTADLITDPYYDSYSGTQKYGSAVPFKFTIAGTTSTSILSTAKAFVNTSANCKGLPTPDAVSVVIYNPQTGFKGNSSFSYNSAGYFQFNWDSSVMPAPGCYTMELTLADGTIWATNVLLK